MRDYELVLIISSKVLEEDVPTHIDKVSEFITSKGGEITSIDRWGKRVLAYPIKHCREGHYVLVQFQADPKMTVELEANLHISEMILRHLLVKLENQTIKS